MKLKPLNWAPDAVPTTNGWVQNGELLKSQKITEDQIKEYLGEEKEEPAMQQLNEAPPNNKSIDKMKKSELQEFIQDQDPPIETNQKVQSLREKISSFLS